MGGDLEGPEEAETVEEPRDPQQECMEGGVAKGNSSLTSNVLMLTKEMQVVLIT